MQRGTLAENRSSNLALVLKLKGGISSVHKQYIRCRRRKRLLFRPRLRLKTHTR